MSQRDAEIAAAVRREREALRRVNQDYTIFGEVERTNLDRLESARREFDRLGISR